MRVRTPGRRRRKTDRSLDTGKALVLLGAVAALLLATATSGEAATTRWTVDGYKILLDGQPFFAKGIGY